MKKRQTPKIRLSRGHQTYIALAEKIRDGALKLEHISMISPAVIDGGVRPGEQHVTLKDENGCVLLMIRGTTAVQELRVYSRNLQDTKLQLARLIRNMGVRIRFRS